MRTGFYLILALLIFFASPQKGFSTTGEEPRKIIIPAVGINLPVAKAGIVGETWEVLSDAASYGENTALPGEVGNTVIFSHAIEKLFGNLVNVVVGTYVYVVTDSYSYTYKIVETNSVEPDNVSILNPGNQQVLTLYTCEGTADEKRFAVKAVLVEKTRSCHYDPLLTREL